MYNPYSFSDFIKRIKDLEYDKILIRAIGEHNSVKKKSYSTPGAIEARKRGSENYITELGQFIYWLRTGTKPAGVSYSNFLLYKEVAKALVEKGQFKQNALENFDNNH